MSRKTKALEQQIVQCNQQLEDLRSQLSQKDLEIKICRDELDASRANLGNVQNELNSANRRLDDYRTREESIVHAITEAASTKERLINEAKDNAKRLEDEGAARRGQLISEGQSVRDKARNEAAATVGSAKEEADRIIAEAELKARETTERAAAEAETTVSEAERTAREMIEEARKTAETMVGDAEDQVMKSRAQLDELNLMLREKAKVALEEAKVYADIYESVADCKDISELNPPCDLDCENCENKCEDYIPMDELRGQMEEGPAPEQNPEKTPEEESVLTPCGKEEPCCAEKAEPADEKPACECGEEPCCHEDETPAGETCGETPAVEEPAVEEPAAEEPVAEELAEAVENAAEEIENTVEEAEEELQADLEGEAHALERDLPDAYMNASALMRSIYSIEGRDLPEEETYDIGEGTPLTAEGDESFEMPVDPDFENLLGDILDDKK